MAGNNETNLILKAIDTLTETTKEGFSRMDGRVDKNEHILSEHEARLNALDILISEKRGMVKVLRYGWFILASGLGAFFTHWLGKGGQ